MFPRARIASVATLHAALLAVATARAAGPSPFAKGPYLQELGAHGVVVRAEVDPPAPMTLHAEAGGRSFDAKDDATSAMHSLRLDGLPPKTTFRYTATSSGARAEGTFTTAPADDDASPVSFIAYGDNRTDALRHASVVRSMLAEPSDFLVHTGDFVDDGGSASDWQTFFDVENLLLRSRCVFAAVGNHELTEAGGASFLRFFGTERALRESRLSETVRWGMVRLFFVNGWGSLGSGADRAWLDRALTAADDEPGLAWRFLVLHHGPYSSGLHGGNERFSLGELEPLLVRHKVALVLSGHDHVYERGASGMLRYVVTGGGGSPLYPLGAPLPTTRKASSIHHYVKFDVTREKVTLVVKRPDATAFETASFSAGADRAWDGEDAVALAPSGPAASAPTVAPAPRAASRPAGACGCSVPGAPAGERDALASILAMCTVVVVARRLRVATRARSALP